MGEVQEGGLRVVIVGGADDLLSFISRVIFVDFLSCLKD